MRRAPAPRDFDGWVAQLAVSHRRQQAREHLLGSGPSALPALRRGLRHQKTVVRRQCVGILDHLVDEATVPDLVAALDDEDPGVCARALHALACDRCKQGECRPGEELFVPRALELLRDHPDPDIRAAAVDALGKVVDRRPEVAAALLASAERDPHPGVRNMARIRTRAVRV